MVRFRASQKQIVIAVSTNLHCLLLRLKTTYHLKVYQSQSLGNTSINEDNWLSILPNTSLKNEVKFEHFEMITKAKLQDRLNIKMDDVYSESIRLKEIHRKFTTDDQKFSVKSTAEKWQYIQKNASDSLPNIKKIISYLLTIPATSAFRSLKESFQ
ncbi:hypothetical protein WA026_005143 [Henosepilachna vigintioctopunctata]|uniref:Uncharacterized protein n=1 Tax=Henosepilachna vigintioctopunctata TaxID=420089 RepID=A0AAW1UT17_9CUCU